MGILVAETWVNRDLNCQDRKSDVYETEFDDLGNLYRALRSEYGRCIGKMYIGNNKHIGWIFEKRKQYDDCNDTFIAETWVSIHDKPSTITVENHYKDL